MPGVTPDPQSARLEDPAAETVTPGRGAQLLREITTGNAMISVLAVVAALFLGAVLIGAADPKVQNAATYLFARPGDFGSALWGAVSNAYSALFQGAVYDFDAQTFAPVSYTHLRAHETDSYLVCRLLLEKKKKN